VVQNPYPSAKDLRFESPETDVDLLALADALDRGGTTLATAWDRAS
jgi:hypothetical protein